ncbi:M28 family peptidase [Undibacterium umbellatum]|uniref:M28 family peptidase n=1 Tax=Undibacterium umbellatum TaxID=2762300 RepID=A0ABR6ZHG8_9BURK|nr:M28 family peptidase [Undibacterium umbellatum]MBC3911187.1 M28 family peptidase [Undibacterium umbellatum]
MKKHSAYYLSSAFLTFVLGLPAHGFAQMQVNETTLRAHLALLSSDLFEGRGTGQHGGDLTVAYLETQAAIAGLLPPNGKSYRQAVSIRGIKSLPMESSVNIHLARSLNLTFGTDWLWSAGDAMSSHRFDHELLFVGYGINAPEEQWDDFKDVDCKGKILVVMVNDPQPTAEQPDRFGGKALTYYGRRSYKTEEALRRGAAGVLLIHTDTSANANWDVLKNGGMGEQFQLVKKDAQGLAIQGWITDGAANTLFAASGLDLNALRQAAERRDFKPVAIKARLKGEAKSQIRQLEQFNIAGIVPGTDAQLKDELVIYSAHWDHMGKQEGAGDVIYNGAVDNGSGTAALLAMAKAAVQQPTKRSQMFLWVAAEEQGLLGSAWYAAHPIWPLNKTAAALNLDTLNFVGRTKDISAFGADRSDLIVAANKVAQSMGMVIAPPRVDVAGGYFRSDHFSFAKAGVPAFSIGSGRDYIHEPQASLEKARGYGKRYHQVTDEYDASWDLSGMTEQAQFTLNLGREIANAKSMPAWKENDVFSKVRK